MTKKVSRKDKGQVAQAAQEVTGSDEDRFASCASFIFSGGRDKFNRDYCLVSQREQKKFKRNFYWKALPATLAGGLAGLTACVFANSFFGGEPLSGLASSALGGGSYLASFLLASIASGAWRNIRNWRSFDRAYDAVQNYAREGDVREPVPEDIRKAVRLVESFLPTQKKQERPTP